VNPFSGCFLILIQIPIIFALYYVFYKGISFNSELLYSFIHAPEHANMIFLGLLDLTGGSLILAFLAGVTQYFQAYFMPQPVSVPAASGSFQDSFTKSMSMQMKYIFPIVIFILLGTDWFGVSLSGAVALYFIASNLFAIGQQIYVDKKREDLIIKL